MIMAHEEEERKAAFPPRSAKHQRRRVSRKRKKKKGKGRQVPLIQLWLFLFLSLVLGMATFPLWGGILQ
ncbi:hypothetical protein ALCH109712_00215 [Alkalicoccus chagannorensis]